MTGFRCYRDIAAAAALLALTTSARAEWQSRAELTCLLASGNLLRGGNSPAADDSPAWEGLTSLHTGHESRTRLATSLQDDGFVPGVATAAMLRVELRTNPTDPSGTPTLSDASSSIAVSWQAWAETQLSLRAFPFDTNYLRLGYLHALDWGGSDVARRDSVFVTQAGGAPGVEATLTTRRVQLFLALKWANATDALQGDRRLWGALSGGSFELGSTWRVDGGFGYFQRSPPDNTLGARAGFVEGASLRLVWHRGPSEPELAAEPFRPPSPREELRRLDADSAQGFALGLETVTLVLRQRRLEDPNRDTLTPAPAAALYGSARGRWLAGHAALTWRSLAFVLRNDPRTTPAETLPSFGAQQAELGAWLGGSAPGAPLHLVPGIELGVRLPAGLATPSAIPGYADTWIAGGAAGFDALPTGAGRLPVLDARLSLRWQASRSVALIGYTDYRRDPNRASLLATPSAVTRAFAPPDSLVALAAVQARL